MAANAQEKIGKTENRKNKRKRGWIECLFIVHANSLCVSYLPFVPCFVFFSCCSIYSHPAGHSLSHSSLDVSAPFAAGNNNPNPSFHAFGSSSAFGNTAPQPARNAHEVAQALAMRMTQSQAMA